LTDLRFFKDAKDPSNSKVYFSGKTPTGRCMFGIFRLLDTNFATEIPQDLLLKP
jgi:hypothetical protein